MPAVRVHPLTFDQIKQAQMLLFLRDGKVYTFDTVVNECVQTFLRFVSERR